MIPHNQPVILIIPGLNEEGSAVRNFQSPADAVGFLMENTEAPPMYAYDPAIGQEKADVRLTVSHEPGRIPTINTGLTIKQDPNAAMLYRDGPEEDVPCEAEPTEDTPTFPAQALDNASPFK